VPSPPKPRSLFQWWREHGTIQFLRTLWNFARESTPAHRRQRYGDMDYDWEHRVNTTSGTVGWRARLLGLFHSPYQPTEPSLFAEMMASLPIDFHTFTFIDVGSGKGRTLLMASEYPFRQIIGVELIAELHNAAEENIRLYQSETQQCSRIESILADACDFDFPNAPLVLYLFNPLPEDALTKVLARLKRSLHENPRPVWLIYHNPLLDSVLKGTEEFKKIYATTQFYVYTSRAGS
jgi:SAM-dependent methyltransferase